MGIETALIGGAVLGGGMNMIGARKAAKEQARGVEAGARAAQEAADAGYADAMKYLSPYVQFGESTLPYLQQAMQDNQSMTYEDYFKSQQFKDLAAQQEEQVARNALATGPGLRSGNTQAGLAAIAPQLAMAEQQRRFSNMFDIAQFGGGFTHAAAQAGMNRGNALGDMRYNSAVQGANARAQGRQAMFSGLGNMIGDAGSIYAASRLGYLDPRKVAGG